MSLVFSRRLAIAIGVGLPLAETLRLWGSRGSLVFGLDHYLAGAFLLIGVWMSRRYDSPGSRYLVAAWAFTCGIGYTSLVRQLDGINGSGAAPTSQIWVAGTVGLGFLICCLGLAASLKAHHDTGADVRSGRG